MSLALATPRRPAVGSAPRFVWKLGTAAALSAIADFLFWERQLGASLAIFAVLVATAVSLSVVPWRRLRRVALPAAGLALGLLPLAENVSVLSVGIGLTALAGFTLAVSNRLRSGLVATARQIVGFLLAAPFRLLPDLVRWRRVARKAGFRTHLAWLGAWVLPLGLGGVFVVLFVAANPIIERWLQWIDLQWLLDRLSPPRIAFWLLVAISAWGFLRPRISWFQRRRLATELAGLARPSPAGMIRPSGGVLLGEASILRALVLFNAIFAVETVLDIIYLWGGVALPDGMNYAEYAHRGAYPLILTALLAAAFVLAATRDGSTTARHPLVRGLVYLWTAQNVMLVVSSILRLDLYVSVYSLTYWRVAAFIWMGLVAAGLVLIVARIALGKSNGWLLAANLATATVTLYVCGFINFAAWIAEYNVDHRPNPRDTTLRLDTEYLAELGPQAIPAIDRLLALDGRELGGWRQYLVGSRMRWTQSHTARMADWRGWTFRGWRLSRYLDQYPATIGADMLDGSRER